MQINMMIIDHTIWPINIPMDSGNF